MTVAITNLGTKKFGAMRMTFGTFTSAVGDTAVSLTRAIHGINRVLKAEVTLDKGGVDTPLPLVADSSSDITATFMDTLGYSGEWRITGHM